MNNSSLNLPEMISNFWISFLDRLPYYFFILVIFLLGCLLAIWLSYLVTRVLKRLRIDDLFRKNSWKRGLEKSGVGAGLSEAAGWVIRWILILLFLSMAAEALGFVGTSEFLMAIVHWLPNLLIAILIFVLAAILVDAAGNIIRISIDWVDASYAFIAEKFARWTIWGLTVLMIFRQIGIAPEMTTILFQGLVYFLVLSFGLAFGLGGQEIARDFLKRLRDKIKKQEK